MSSKSGKLASQVRRSARSISQTVVTALQRATFHGRVLSCFPAACNLADETGRVVSLVTPEVGDGPLNVVLDGRDPFAGIKAGMRAKIAQDRADIGDRLTVDLKAVVWNPLVTWSEIAPAALATLWSYVQERATSESLLTCWVPAIRPLSGVRMAFHETARGEAERLLLALQQNDQTSVVNHTLSLSGLGPGSTPAGDDFMMGLMAGLRAWPQFLTPGGLSADHACALVGLAAVSRTHIFSAAHLRAAQAGQMGAGWHRLAAALAAGDEPAIRQAAGGLLAFGATSGADAMAGFLGPYLLTGT